jgi:hypothetical protein
MVSAFSIGKAQRSCINLHYFIPKESVSENVKNPGPGSYEPRVEPLSSKHKSPKWTIKGSKKSEFDSREKNPAPGNHFTIPQ